MNYDDLILECKGDCDSCEVFLECQYQTSSGEEKQKYLDMLNARDAKPSLEENAEENIPTETEEVVETETITETEEVEEEFADTVFEEVAAFELKEVTDETVETITAEEATDETVADFSTVDTENAPVTKITPPSKEEVDAIFNEVFNLTVCDETSETAIKTETALESDNEVSETNDDTVTETSEELLAEKQEDSISEVREDIVNETYSTAPEDTVICDETDVSLPSDETVAEIFDEVFNLPDQLEAETETSNVQTEKAEVENITPPSREEVDAIFNEVFKLNEIKADETSFVEEQTPSSEDVVETSESAEPTEVQSKTETAINLQEASFATEAESEKPKSEVVLEENVPVKATPEQPEEKPSVEPAFEAAQETTESASEPALEAPAKEVFKLVPPENNEELLAAMCAKRARKLIYKPSEALITVTYKVLGTDKKNDIGEKVKDILDAEIKQGVKLGYLDKFDGLSSAEIKEEYENDIVYEFAEQEFKKTGVILDGKKVKVYIYDWDGKACHNVGYVNADEAAELIPYLQDKESYSFDVCGIITGGKGKRVVKEGNTLKIVKEKGDPIGLDVDIAVLKRKD